MEAPTSSFGLLERSRQGDQEAFTALFHKYQRRLAVLVYYKLGAGQRPLLLEVDEILQETFLEAFRDLSRFEYRSAGAFFRWLSRIADHVLADAARYHGRRKRHAVALERFRSESNPQGPEPVDTKTPSRLLADKEAVERLLDKLDSLPEDYRQAIVLTKMEGLTTAEMGARLGRSREAAALLLHRALKRFRQT